MTWFNEIECCCSMDSMAEYLLPKCEVHAFLWKWSQTITPNYTFNISLQGFRHNPFRPLQCQCRNGDGGWGNHSESDTQSRQLKDFKLSKLSMRTSKLKRSCYSLLQYRILRKLPLPWFTKAKGSQESQQCFHPFSSFQVPLPWFFYALPSCVCRVI